MIDEAPPPFRPAGQDREVAVGTDGGAEGDVEVEAGRASSENLRSYLSSILDVASCASLRL
jgi:hypothetical protein